MKLQQGHMVRVAGNPDHTYQVLSIDEDTSTCWVRRWPLSRKGSPAFSLSLHQLAAVERTVCDRAAGDRTAA